MDESLIVEEKMTFYLELMRCAFSSTQHNTTRQYPQLNIHSKLIKKFNVNRMKIKKHRLLRIFTREK